MALLFDANAMLWRRDGSRRLRNLTGSNAKAIEPKSGS